MGVHIDREQALSHPFANGKYDHEHANEHFILGFESYREWLEGLPTIDLVKCGECKWFVDDGWGFGHCERPFVGHLSTAEYGFCSEGERRSE